MRHAQTSSKPASYTQVAEATTNHENDNEPRRTASITKQKMKPKVTRVYISLYYYMRTRSQFVQTHSVHYHYGVSLFVIYAEPL